MHAAVLSSREKIIEKKVWVLSARARARADGRLPSPRKAGALEPPLQLLGREGGRCGGGDAHQVLLVQLVKAQIRGYPWLLWEPLFWAHLYAKNIVN